MRIELPLNISFPTVNAYLMREPVPTLVDCGLNTPESRDSLESALQGAGLALSDIRRVVITHPHVDHIGLAGTLAMNGADVWLSDLAAEWMAELDEQRSQLIGLMLTLLSAHGFDEDTLTLAKAFYRGMAPMFSAIPPESIRIFRAGDAIELDGRPWQVLEAPGHTNRQVCFYQPEAQELFSADMLLPKAPVPMIEGRPDDPAVRSPGLPVLLESYQKFSDLAVRRVYPGHGSPFSNHRDLIEKQVRRIHRRKTECFEWINGGVGRLPDLLGVLYPHLPPTERLGGLAMLIGYIDLLILEGRVQQVSEAGELRYIPA